MSARTCIITGASSGIGKEITFKLANAGHKVIIICRDEEKGKNLIKELQQCSASNNIELFIADLSQQSHIRSLVEKIKNKYQVVDVLINNAGCVLTKKMLSDDGIEMTLATNFLAPFLLTHLLVDLLANSADARVINISSAIHKWGKLDLTDLQYMQRKYHFIKAYAQSKLLLNIATFEFSKKLATNGIKVNCLHPGAVKSNLGSDNAKNTIVKLIDKAIKAFFITTEQAARFPVLLAISPEMQHITGSYFEKGKAVSSSPISYDQTLAQQVWTQSLALVNLTGVTGSSLEIGMC